MEHPEPEMRIWLAIPHDERQTAVTAGGKLADGLNAIIWSKEEQLWYARPGADPERIKPWLPDRTLRSGGGDPASEFYDAMTSEGLILKGLPVMDGKRHRVATLEDKSGKQSGVYRGFLDGRPAGWFINYHRAETEKSVTNWKASGGEADPHVRLHIRAVMQQSQDDAARERAATYATQTAKAHALYDRLPPADPAHPYLQRKAITPTDDLRQTRNGALVVPFYDVYGAFQTLQYIPPEGDKYLFKDAPKVGHYLVVGGALRNGDPILYAEGYATARSLSMVTDRPVVMTIDAGNMLAVAGVLKASYPDSPHLFMADVDHAKEINKGVLSAERAAAVTGGIVLLPDLTAAEIERGYTDFNDLHVFRGVDRLRETLLPAIAQALEQLNDKDTSMATPDDAQPAPDNLAAATPDAAVDSTPPRRPGTAKEKTYEILKLRDEGLKPAQIAEQLGIGQTSVYRILKAQQPEAAVPEPAAADMPAGGGNDLPAAPPATERETITLYHGSPATFSAIDAEKIGSGQNFMGRGFYTDTSVIGLHYAMEEINHPDYHVYELEIPSHSIILDRWDSSSLTDALRERIREAGKTFDQQRIEKGDTSRLGIGDSLADCEKIDATFFMHASSPEGMRILNEAGIDALKDNSYIAIINTDLIDNLRLRSAVGTIRTEMTQYIDKALGNAVQDASKLSDILQEKPDVSIHYDAIRSELVSLAKAQNKPEEAERLTALLTHTLVETIDSTPDRKTTITPLNRLYAEAIRSLGLNHDNSSATLGHLIDSAVININPHHKPVADPVKPESAAADATSAPESVVAPPVIQGELREALDASGEVVDAPTYAGATLEQMAAQARHDTDFARQQAVSETTLSAAPAAAAELPATNAQDLASQVQALSQQGRSLVQIAAELNLGVSQTHRLLQTLESPAVPDTATSDLPISAESLPVSPGAETSVAPQPATMNTGAEEAISPLNTAQAERAESEPAQTAGEAVNQTEAFLDDRVRDIEMPYPPRDGGRKSEFTDEFSDVELRMRTLLSNADTLNAEQFATQFSKLVIERKAHTGIGMSSDESDAGIYPDEVCIALEKQLEAKMEQKFDSETVAPAASVPGEKDAILTGPRRMTPSDEPVPEALRRIDLDKLLSRMTDELHPDGKSVLFKLDGEHAFTDYGNRLVMAEGASHHEEKVLAALLTAAQYYHGRIELTGSDAFKSYAISLIVAHNLDVTMKVASQQAELTAARRATGQPDAPADAVAGTDPGPAPINPQSDRASAPTAPPTEPAVATRTEPVTASRGNASTVPETPPEKETSTIKPSVHTPAEKAREPVTGKVTACGQAPFRFEAGESESTFITLRSKEGSQTFWGKELAGLLRETRLEPGRMVTLQWHGKQPVTVKVPKKDQNGVVMRYDSVDTHRNQWSLTPVGGDRVQTGNDQLVTMAAFDAARFTQVQHAVVTRLGLDMPAPPVPADGLYWLRPDGQGSQNPGDALSAPRPEINDKAGAPVMSSWAEDGSVDLYLVQGDGHYLQGVVRREGEYQHVLVSLSGNKEAPPMVFNVLTPDGAVPIGSGNGINRANGNPVPRENLVVHLQGDEQRRIAKLEAPSDMSPALHARLGFDERYKAEAAFPKEWPAAAPQAAPVTPPRPV
ncbi:LPD7 domain-containing protein [Rahnella sikkimica]|uniref:DNA primase n=1 Tax=Rahnella sikkimica TaxID=1805933 RepID=A0A2L1UZ28_9GAMM|nr:LPD7 domain-containing protein [Rahnella sikkimica]AVF38213.1 hypothetical protein BV494_25380 [Rahnella sikkimica]